MFTSKQTPLDQRMGATDVAPREAMTGSPTRPTERPIQVEGDGPEVMMEPLRQADPDERISAIAAAQADTDIAAAREHAEVVKAHAHNHD